MAKIYHVIQIKLNQLIWENVHMITCLTAITVTNILSEFLPTWWRQKLTGIDTEQDYVTVTLCISLFNTVLWFRDWGLETWVYSSSFNQGL